MNVASGLLIALCSAGLAAGAATAETALKVAADTPSVEISPRRAGRNFLRLPTIEFNFSVHAECGDDGSAESVSLSVADTREALGAKQLGEDKLGSLTLRIPAKQIAPLVVEDFCIIGNVNDPGRAETHKVSGALSVQASLLCRTDAGDKMTYATEPLDVTLVCKPVEEPEVSE